MVTFSEQEDATRVPKIFEMVEDSISASHRGQDKKRARERKLSTDLVFVPAWREATIRFAENLPMELLIQEFDRFYPNLRPNKKIRVGESDQTVIVQKDGEAIYLPADILQNIVLRLQPADLVTSRSISHDWNAVYDSNSVIVQKDGEAIYLPADILQNIVLRLQPADLVTSRSISHDWNAVYDSKYFQRTHDLIEQCIVVNNHNLDIWGFSVISRRWFLMKIRCDWDTFGMRTLGVKASCSGLFLVARSDLTLFVVNPLTSECKSLPRIFPHYTRKRVRFLKSLIVHGTAEMTVDEEATGSYRVFLLGNCEDNGNSFLQVATYDSTLKSWRVQKRNWLMGYPGPFYSPNFPGPMRSFWDNNDIVCFSAASLARQGLPTGIEIQNFYGEGHINVTFPTMVPCNAGQRVLIGRLKGKEGVGGVYGRLPIVPHSDLGIWNFDGLTGQWNLVKVVTVEFMQTMIESSEGTDFLAVGDGLDHIWLMLKGSKYMLQYTISTGILQLQPGCPGGGYMDANISWRAVFEALRFNAAV